MGRESSKKKGQQSRPAAPETAGEAAPAPLGDLRTLERAMSDLHRLLAEQDLTDLDEVNQFLQDLASKGAPIPRSPALTPLEKAQDLMHEAWEADGAQRARLARRALKVCPDCADAYVLLAEETARTVEEARDLFAQGVAAGERALGAEFFENEAGNFWAVLESRPYMRAREGLAGCLWRLGEREGAVEHYGDMLRLNPNDNQGIRYILLGSLLEMGRDDQAGDLLRQYEDDGTAAWLYDYSLWAFRREGDSPEARRRLKEALAQNPHVPVFLLGRRSLPSRLPDWIGFGDENEAVSYAVDALHNWQATAGALAWLAGCAGAIRGGRRGRAPAHE